MVGQRWPWWAQRDLNSHTCVRASKTRVSAIPPHAHGTEEEIRTLNLSDVSRKLRR